MSFFFWFLLEILSQMSLVVVTLVCINRAVHLIAGTWVLEKHASCEDLSGPGWVILI